MRGRRFVICVGIAAAFMMGIAGCSDSENPVSQKEQGKQPVAPTVTDPVCGMNLTSDQVVATYEYEGKTYHFCMASDRDAFAADPVKFLSGGPGSCPHQGGAGPDSCWHNGRGHCGMDSTECPHGGACCGADSTGCTHDGGGHHGGGMGGHDGGRGGMGGDGHGGEGGGMGGH